MEDSVHQLFSDPSFRKAFSLAADKAMLLLGDSGRRAVYYHVEKSFGLRRGEWHEKPELFEEVLRRIFGVGAELLFRAIAFELYSNLGLEFDLKGKIDFSYIIRQAERRAKKGRKPFKVRESGGRKRTKTTVRIKVNVKGVMDNVRL